MCIRRHVPAAVLLVVVGLLAFLPTPLFAQSDTGVIDGRVFDESKAAVPGANVTARNVATGLTRSAVASDRGTYRIESLPPGTYEVTAELQGFATHSRQGHRRPGWNVVHGGLQHEGRGGGRDGNRPQRIAARADHQVGRRAGDYLRAGGEHAAQRAEVPGPVAARARHPAVELLRSDQDGGRRRQLRRDAGPVGEHHRGWRRQQRRRRSRPAAAVQRRRDPGIQGHDQPLQRRVRTIDGRRRERDHQERHERHPRHRVPVRPRRAR